MLSVSVGRGDIQEDALTGVWEWGWYGGVGGMGVGVGGSSV